MKRLDVIALLALITIGGSQPTGTAQSAECTPSGGLTFICGIQNPEDLVLVPNTRWLLASGMAPGSGLHLVDTRAKTVRNLYPSDAPSSLPDRARYASCPGPLDPKLAVLHGLSLRPATDGRYTVYATNHGGRESIEVFELATGGGVPTATWIGCVLMPNDIPANSVAAFKDGSLVATALILPGKSFEDAFAGRDTGAVFLWTPGDISFLMLPGTELSANNGIETSARRQRVLRRLNDPKAHRRLLPRQPRKAAAHRAARGVWPRQRPVDERQSADHRRNDRQRAGLRRPAKDRSRYPMLARLHRGYDRPQEDDRDRACARTRDTFVYRHGDRHARRRRAVARIVQRGSAGVPLAEALAVR